jgi:hypothetical protein
VSRDTVPRPFVADKTFEVEVFDLNGSLVEHEIIRCEEYYDISCSARGNHYAFRQTPKSRQFSLPYGNDTIELEFPGCAQLVRNEELRPVYFTRYYRDSQTGQKWPLRLDRDGSFLYRDGKNEPVHIEVIISAVKREVE